VPVRCGEGCCFYGTNGVKDIVKCGVKDIVKCGVKDIVKYGVNSVKNVVKIRVSGYWYWYWCWNPVCTNNQ
jgi:hypothetical protein